MPLKTSSPLSWRNARFRYGSRSSAHERANEPGAAADRRGCQAPGVGVYDGYLLSSEEFRIFPEIYLSNEVEQLHPYAAPSLAADLHGLPPALVITAECDPLRDGGEEYGQRLLEAGVPATVSRYEGMIHGFMYMRNLVPQEAHQAFTEATHALRLAFADNKS